MSSNLPMPCAIRNLSSYPLPGKHVPQVVIEINGEKDGGKRTFSTLDLVEGTAVVTVTQETYLGHVDITFEGTSTTSASRAVSFVPGRRKASHKFLRLRQPIDNFQETRLVPGQSYKFPFSFEVPESIGSQQCDHSTKDAEVEEAHTQLPPTFESRSSKFWQSTAGGWAPKACRISYKIRVVLSEKSQAFTGTTSSKVCDVSRSIRIMPAAKMAKVLGCPLHYLVHEKQSECRSLGRNLGNLLVAAEEPRKIQISAPRTGMNKISTSAVELHITFDPKTNIPPPQLCKIRSKLEVATYYGTSPWEDYPTTKEMECASTDREAYITTTPLQSLDLTSIQWEKLPSFYAAKVKSADSASEYSVSSSGTSPEHSYTVSVTVPINIPEEQALVSTFHSCLVSRTYAIDLVLSYQVPSAICKSTMNMRIPIEVVFGRWES
ncbi:hypothetical protein PEBR_27378 [Penicillium brasilianum]|uniref:Arrestin-like N-terminal domain-containing protein n=1 Tax=Penicillium brasilianum TaxID=104259 RepID=A0A1S9RUW4_PENBI|nr:hypothetical protein PEBR_27378 [Penicillium brasilianum]